MILDATAVVSDPALESTTWQEIREAIADSKARVVVPQFVFVEVVATLKRKQRDSVSAVRSQRVPWGRFGKRVLDHSAGRLEESPRVETELREVFRDAGVEILPSPSVSHELVVRRAAARVRPFNSQGTGYRDTLHWYFLLDLFDGSGEQEDIVLVSNDVSAFGGEGADKATVLHADLLRDLRNVGITKGWADAEERVVWVKALAHIEVPDVFEAVELDPATLLSAEELNQGIAAAVAISLPRAIDPSSTPFGQSVIAATATGVLSASTLGAVARRYLRHPDRVAITFDADVLVNVVGASGIEGALRNLSLLATLRVSGRVDFSLTQRAFGASELVWLTAMDDA